MAAPQEYAAQPDLTPMEELGRLREIHRSLVQQRDDLCMQLQDALRKEIAKTEGQCRGMIEQLQELKAQYLRADVPAEAPTTRGW